jgi:hypothetical protein
MALVIWKRWVGLGVECGSKYPNCWIFIFQKVKMDMEIFMKSFLVCVLGFVQHRNPEPRLQQQPIYY